jgi:hypothetical protein
VRRHRVGDLEPDRATEPAAGQFPLQGLQQILVAILFDLEIGIAGDPEQMPFDYFHAGEELIQMCRDQVLDREKTRLVGRFDLQSDIALPGDRDESRHVVRHLDPGEPVDVVFRIAHRDGQIE